MLTPVEHGPQPHHRRTLFGGHAVVLARSHRELAQAVALRQLPEAPEVRPRGLGIAGLGRHRHQAYHALVETEEILQIALRQPGFRLLAGEVHLDERRDLEPSRRRLARERVAELAELVDRSCLAALEMADEMPAE